MDPPPRKPRAKWRRGSAESSNLVPTVLDFSDHQSSANQHYPQGQRVESDSETLSYKLRNPPLPEKEACLNQMEEKNNVGSHDAEIMEKWGLKRSSEQDVISPAKLSRQAKPQAPSVSRPQNMPPRRLQDVTAMTPLSKQVLSADPLPVRRDAPYAPQQKTPKPSDHHWDWKVQTSTPAMKKREDHSYQMALDVISAKEKENVEKTRLLALKIIEEENSIKKELCRWCDKMFILDHMYTLDACYHRVCRTCAGMRAKKSIGHDIPTCPFIDPKTKKECGMQLLESDFSILLTPKAFARWEKAVLKRFLSDVDAKECPSCKTMFSMQLGDGKLDSAPQKDSKGQQMSEESRKHYATYHARCPQCNSEFCMSCEAHPYHENRTCDEEKFRLEGKQCRFCQSAVLPNARGYRQEVCDSTECHTLYKSCCASKLPCGHWCCGIAHEKDHIGCLREDCVEFNEAVCNPPSGKMPTNAEDFCNICFVSSLSDEPSIQLKCGHVIHWQCIKDKVKARWPTSRMSFNFLNCPLCSTRMDHDRLTKYITKDLQLEKDYHDRAVRRLKYEQREDEAKKKDMTPLQFALSVFNYYLCFKCNTPYFGGLRACGAVDVEESNIKREDLVCPSCSGQTKGCKKHGTDFIQYKCRFCCKVAVWYCWGTTHFCDECHKIAPRIARKPHNELPKCSCNTVHPPNGNEFCFGCSICRGERDM